MKFFKAFLSLFPIALINLISTTFLHTPALSINIDKTIDDTTGHQLNYIYLKEPALVNSQKTITYLYGSNIENKQIVSFFMKFSAKIGKNNGVVILDKNDKNYFDFIKKTKCEIDFNNNLSVIMFEIRDSNECIVIPANEASLVESTIGYIYQNIDNPQKIKQHFLTNQALERIKYFIEWTAGIIEKVR